MTTPACEDCGATSSLRWVRLLTAPSCWLCVDADACRARRRGSRPATAAERTAVLNEFRHALGLHLDDDARAAWLKRRTSSR